MLYFDYAVNYQKNAKIETKVYSVFGTLYGLCLLCVQEEDSKYRDFISLKQFISSINIDIY